MSKSRTVTLVGPTDSLVLNLPLVEVSPGIVLAIFNPLGDWWVNEWVGKALAKRVPKDTEALVMPDGKAQALLHVVGRETGLPTFVLRKEHKGYMGPCESVRVQSITTNRVQNLFLPLADYATLRGRRVAIVDDVVSTGASIGAVRELLDKAGALPGVTLCVFTEGTPRPEVVSLGHLPY